MSTEHYPMRAWMPSLLIASIAWGSSFVFIKMALDEFAPAHVGFIRLVVGVSVLILIVGFQRAWPRLSWRTVGGIAVVAIGMSGVPMVLIPMAEERITSILASLLNATTPLWTALFVALLIPHERTSRAQLAGLGVGAVGIAVLVGAWDVNSLPLAGTVLMLVATAFYGIGGTLSRLLLTKVDATPAALSMTQVGLSAVMLAPFALLAGQPGDNAFSLSHRALWGVLALGVFGTSFAYVLFWRVVKMAGATTASSVTYLSPIAATLLGILVLGETLHWYEPVGALIVFAGVFLAGRAHNSKARRVAVQPTPVPALEPAASNEADAGVGAGVEGTYEPK